MNHSDSLLPLKAADIDEVGELGRSIWRQHYVTIISGAQIEYMLQGKYSMSDLSRYFTATDQWFDVLRVAGVISGFLRTSCAEESRFKLEEIYVSQAVRGQGYGRLLLERAESLAHANARQLIYLYVNRANAGSIAAYQKSGFIITKSQVFDIGNGFAMDDHLMEKSLAHSNGSRHP
jgi:ribosomal protein S18 acetylase RimI-like enzyme